MGERNLISVAYKNAVGSRHASWRIISSVEQKEASKGNTQNVDMAKAYRIRVETELNRICDEILQLFDGALIPTSTSGECKTGAANNAHVAYKEAMAVATTDLVVTHPIRLGLALNFSVFHYEVLGNPEEACKMARQAFEDAIAELDSVSEDSYKDSTLIMQLLRDNLTLWTSDGDAGDGAQ